MGNIVEEVEVGHLREHPDERAFLAPFLTAFDITWAKQRQAFGTKLSVYLLKPEPFMEEAFGFEREILLAYSPFKTLQPRVIQGIEQFLLDHPAKGRADTMIIFLVSEAEDPADWVSRYVSSNPESRLIATFTADGLRSAKGDSWYVRSILSSQLYQRNLFDYRLPLHSDAYFFGREDLVFDFFNAIKRSENRGLFGLRKTGKTSVLFKLGRLIDASRAGHYIYYDCKYPGIRASSWESLLDQISNDISRKVGALAKGHKEGAADRFLSVVENSPKGTTIVLVFDEIEYVSPFTSLDLHWRSEFVPFWQTLWACQSRFRNLSIIVAGVNPTVVEQDLIDKVQNPLFGIIPAHYLKGFRLDELQRMVRHMGRRIGLRFEHSAFNYLHERYGGHPLLTRIACSLVHKAVDETRTQRPFDVTTEFLRQHEGVRDNELSFYCRHVVSELREFYKDEYDLLEALASGQTAEFIEFTFAPEFTSHLTHYGLLAKDSLGRPRISIPVVGRYLGLEAARREGRRTILRVVQPAERAAWLRKRIEAIETDLEVLQRLTRDADPPSIFGPSSYPESHKFHAVPICESETDFTAFINACYRCFVESIEAYGASLGKKDYIHKDIATTYPALYESLQRIRLYRHHRAHLRLYPKVDAELSRFLASDLERRNPSQVQDFWFVLQQCVLDSLLTGVITEVDRLS